MRPLYIHVGVNANQTFWINTINISTSSLGIKVANLSTGKEADRLTTKIDNAQSIILIHLANVGADYEALTHHRENVLNIVVSLQRLGSLIRNPDLALELMEYVKQRIRQKGDELLIKHTNNNSIDVLRLFSNFILI